MNDAWSVELIRLTKIDGLTEGAIGESSGELIILDYAVNG